jgi:hypothetical protein
MSLPLDILKYIIQFIDDTLTLRSYLCVVPVDQPTMTKLKQRFRKHVVDKCDDYKVSYYALPNGSLYGRMCYISPCIQVTGLYINNVEVSTFTITKSYPLFGKRHIYEQKFVVFTKGHKKKSTTYKYDKGKMIVTRYINEKKIVKQWSISQTKVTS